ncbi:hypothetical protein GE061_019371 [Apolygus lucorum]|uniref:Uncharacterized protein n=1 Tax=Apolygus lucorum TaxID=248454 RepID=A0A8S9X9M1_APOLU|nr:hypothetical protein GE061_019371 [Apolygus lucorum]
MSASEVKELLASWQLPEEVIDLIIGEGYDSIDLIRCLTPEEVATNVVHFPKAVFKTLYCKGWRSKFLPEGPPTTSQPTETVLTLIHGESRTITTKDLQCPPTEIDDPSTRSRGDLLKTNRVFRLLKDSHSPALVKKALSGGQLSRAEATRLVHLWTDFCSKSSEAAGEKRWKTSYTQLQLWAEEIVECFPSESVESDGIEAYNYQVGKLRKILQDYSTAVTLAARQKAEEVGDSSCVKTKIHILLDLYDKTVESGTHRTRVTALDAARYFVHRVADEAELTEFEEGRIEHLKQSIRKQHNNYSEEQIDGEVINVLKPIITAFGPSWDNISHYNVNIPAGKSPRIIYSFSSLVEASAYFVLSVFALHINYPNPCESVWVFIQQKLLEIQPDSLTCRSQSYCESLRFLESFLDNRDLPQYLSEDPQEGSTLSFAPLIISTPSEKSLYCSLTVVEPQQVGSSQNLSASSPLKGVTEGELTSQPKKSDWGLTEGEESVAKKVSPPVLSEASSSEEEGPSTRVPPSKKRRVKRRL